MNLLWDVYDCSYSGHQINVYTLNCPRDTFLPRTYYFFQISQPAKMCLKNRYFEEEFWGELHWVPLTFSWRRGGPSNLAWTKGKGSIKVRQALHGQLCIMRHGIKQRTTLTFVQVYASSEAGLASDFWRCSGNEPAFLPQSERVAKTILTLTTQSYLGSSTCFWNIHLRSPRKYFLANQK